MPRQPNLYQVLGLAPGASSVDIADAFREKLAALKAKPGGGSDEEVQDVRYAYQVLASPAARAEYDAEMQASQPRKAVRAGAGEELEAKRVLMDVLRETGALKFIVPAVILAMVAVFYKMRQPSQEYPTPPRIVEVARTVTQEAVQKDDEPVAPASAGTAAAAAPETASPPASAGPMTAEDVFASASGSVARIQTMDASGKVLGQGSGVVIGSGIVITNCHVVADSWQNSVKVGGKVFEGIVLVADKELDLCSLRVTGLSAPAVALGTSEVRVGQRVYAIGAPQGELALSEGLVSSLRETARGSIIQTTAPISPGSSGGGLFNASGQLIGVVSFQSRTGQDLNYAVPAAWIAEMKQRGAS